MDKTPDYSKYTWDQLQDALVHINREKYPLNFVVLQTEIERRSKALSMPESSTSFSALAPPLPEASTSQTPSTSAVGYFPLFRSWFVGMVIGIGVGQTVWEFWISKLLEGMRKEYGGGARGWGWFWLGCVLFSALLCSGIGLLLGLSHAKEH